MARTYQMSWDEKAKRWQRATPSKYLSVAAAKTTKVSCRQLETPSTKLASYQAANEWWLKQVADWEHKLSESKQQAFPQAQEDAETLDQMVVWLKDRNQTEEAEAKELLARRIRTSIDRGEEPDYLDSEVFQISDWNHENDDEWLAARAADIEVWMDRLSECRQLNDPDDSVGAWSEKYLATIRPTTKPQSMDNIERQLNEFLWWRGRTSSCRSNDEETVRKFYDALQKNQKAPSTNRDTFRMTFRRFVLFLAEHRLIEMPLNLYSKVFRFETTTTPDAASRDEIIELLEGAEDRLRLYVLLCLNCGMNNADIGKMQNTEMNSPRGIPDRNYKIPSQQQFDKAVRWLGNQLGVK